MPSTDILIVEDDICLMEVTRDYLIDCGFTVNTCASGSAALELLKTETFKLIILDINLPDLIGFDICCIIRKTSKVPIIILSARISDMDKVTGLDVGADDYISKPYSLNELHSRIKAQLRRTYDYAIEEKDKSDRFSFEDVEVDFTARTVYIKGAEVYFPAKEYDLLTYLITNRNKLIPKETLYNMIWGFDSMGEINTLSVHIRRIREKIEKDPSNPKFLKTIWSVGFRFEV